MSLVIFKTRALSFLFLWRRRNLCETAQISVGGSKAVVEVVLSVAARLWRRRSSWCSSLYGASRSVVLVLYVRAPLSLFYLSLAASIPVAVVSCFGGVFVGDSQFYYFYFWYFDLGFWIGAFWFEGHKTLLTKFFDWIGAFSFSIFDWGLRGEGALALILITSTTRYYVHLSFCLIMCVCFFPIKCSNFKGKRSSMIIDKIHSSLDSAVLNLRNVVWWWVKNQYICEFTWKKLC